MLKIEQREQVLPRALFLSRFKLNTDMPCSNVFVFPREWDIITNNGINASEITNLQKSLHQIDSVELLKFQL